VESSNIELVRSEQEGGTPEEESGNALRKGQNFTRGTATDREVVNRTG